MTIHGVEKERTMEGNVLVKNKEIRLTSIFKIIFADHNVVIPALYSGVIPPDAQVKFDVLLEPFKKNEIEK